MKRLTPARAFFLSMSLVAAVTWSQTKVDQGKPGNQGPWPVTITSGGSGGGSSNSGLAVTESPCTSPVESVIIFDGGGATPCPITSLSGRRTVTMCNSPKNTGTPLWTVRADGTAPTIFASSPGQTLGLGDCISYYIGATSGDAGVPLYCISDTSSSVLTVTECK